ncbi:acetate uptake transporter [Actinomadura sp. WMMB 499]|uniref:acetate uptake transporter n=1 Tax=Actinomadura sp. WMMB 499 TaxID=1219491 RepID=UPI00159DF4F4|nr:acetate uptake transporter [Actinomadura sp. WMMB 499]
MAERREESAGHREEPAVRRDESAGRRAESGGHRAESVASAAPGVRELERDEFGVWEDRTRVFLQPVAAPSILGLFGLAAAAMMVGAWQADWYGNPTTPLVLSLFVLTFGGLAQLLAGMWSYRAQDGLATAVHGLWGAFWLAWGLMWLLIATGVFPVALAPTFGTTSPAFAFWFVVLALVTGFCAVAALGRNMMLTLLLAALAVGAGFTAAGFFAGSTWPLRIGGWLFVVAAAIAVYTAAAMMMENTVGRTVLPLFKTRRGRYVPEGPGPSRPLEYRYGQPGVKIGQ